MLPSSSLHTTFITLTLFAFSPPISEINLSLILLTILYMVKYLCSTQMPKPWLNTYHSQGIIQECCLYSPLKYKLIKSWYSYNFIVIVVDGDICFRYCAFLKARTKMGQRRRRKHTWVVVGSPGPTLAPCPRKNKKFAL